MQYQSSNKHADISWSRRGAVLLKSAVFADVRVRVDNSSFSCHKIVLASASEFFEKWFQRDVLKKREVVLSETTPKIFETFLNYLYTWNEDPLKNLDPGELLSLLNKSHMWGAVEVEQKCSELISNRCSSMQPNELIKLYGASYLLSNKTIMDKVIQTLQQRFGNQMNLPETLNLGIDCFKEYFQHTIRMDQCTRFSLAEKWILQNFTLTGGICISTNGNPNNSEPVSVLDKLTQILGSIDFEKMPLDQFYNGPGKSKVLDDSSKVELMYKIARKSRNSYH